MSYHGAIRAVVLDVPAHQVEAAMRLEHGTLDALDCRRFNLAAREAASLVRQLGPAGAQALAASYGLTAEEA